ncbi:MAG: coenzyme-B sulfoethylthiotransferase subunit alpha [Candidatus Syntropharchaeales archaeon]
MNKLAKKKKATRGGASTGLTDLEDKYRNKMFHEVTEGTVISSELAYSYDPLKLKDEFMPAERQREIYKALDTLFNGEPMDTVDEESYRHGGVQQCKSKRDWTEWGKKISVERGIPQYNREMGIPLGQRYYEPVLVSNTDYIVDYDDFSVYNNCAIQQLMDDMRKTVIIGLDVPHRVIQLRLGKEISPESMNLYMETMQHVLAGGAVVQEHMAETHPGLVTDAYAKIITGNADLAEQFDRRWVMSIEKEFHPSRAEPLHETIGNRLFNTIRTHTLRLRMTNGAAVIRSAAIAVTMSFVAAYKLTGESVLSDISFATRHAQAIHMGQPLWLSRAQSPNEPGGIPIGYWADMCCAEKELPNTPWMKAVTIERDMQLGKDMTQAVLECCAIASHMDSVWYGVYMSGGLGFPAFAYLYCGNILDDWLNRFTELCYYNWEGHERFPDSWDCAKGMGEVASLYLMETYEKYPTLMELHWGGAIRCFITSAIADAFAALLTGDALQGSMVQNYIVSLLMKEGWLRTGFGGQEVQAHCGPAYGTSLRIEEGGLPELRGSNYPMMSYTATHTPGYITGCYAAMIGRGSSWSCSPLVKVAFADPDSSFDFKEPRLCIAKGCANEFEPQGERDLIRPAR